MVSRFDLVPFHLPIFAMPQAMAAPPQSLAGVWCQSCGCHDVMALWNSSGFDSKATCWWIQYPGSPAQRFPHGERKMLSGCRLIPWMWGPYLFAINKYMPAPGEHDADIIWPYLSVVNLPQQPLVWTSPVTNHPLSNDLAYFESNLRLSYLAFVWLPELLDIKLPPNKVEPPGTFNT